MLAIVSVTYILNKSKQYFLSMILILNFELKIKIARMT